MKHVILFVAILAMAAAYTGTGQELDRRSIRLSGPHWITRVQNAPLPAGTYTVGDGGDFPTLDDAFDRLSYDGILGSVTFLLTDSLYVASPAIGGSFTLFGPIAGAGPDSRITIRPQESTAVTIRGAGSCVLWFQDVSFLTLDGVSLEGPARLRIHALFDTVGTQWNDAIDFLGDCDFNTIQNLTALTEDIVRNSAAVFLGSDNYGGPDSCLIAGVSVLSGKFGIYLCSFAPGWPHRPQGNIISNNHIGSPFDSLISRGIQLEGTYGSLIEGNHVEHLRLSLPDRAGTVRVHGIVAHYCQECAVRSNVIHDICATQTDARVKGIVISGGTETRGQNVTVYNNAIHDLKNGVEPGGSVFGIHGWSQDSLTVCYNTVYLEESYDVAPIIGSGCGFFESSNVYPSLLNNIFINMRDDSPYLSTALDLDSDSLISDFNNMAVGAFSSASLVRSQYLYYTTLPEWQTTGKDLHSVSGIPAFRGPNLHVDTSDGRARYLDSLATPIPGFAYDIDGQPRDPISPDIGADEFNQLPGYVEMISPTIGEWLMVDKTDTITWSSHGLLDIRIELSTDDGVTWPIVVAEKASGSDHQFVWTVPAYPSLQCMLRIMDTRDDWRTATSASFRIGDSRTIARRGWNLLSIPHRLGNYDLQSVYPTGTSQAFFFTDHYVAQETLRNGAGFWLKFGEAETINVFGQPVLAETIDVAAGWNIVGSISVPVTVAAISSDPPGMITSNVYRYLNGYVKVESIEPGMGCWIKTEGAGKLILGAGGGSIASRIRCELADVPPPPPTDNLESIMDTNIPTEHTLDQNYPNPFNPTTTLRYGLPDRSKVIIEVYNTLGQTVATLVNAEQDAGYRSVDWVAASGVGSGAYFYRLTAISVADPARTFVQVRKMILMK